MKKLLLTVTLSLACVAAFAQGKVNFINDSLHLVYFTTDTSHLAASDSAFAGHAYTVGQGGQSLTVELWAGTSSTSMTLQSTTDFVGQSAVGKWNSKNVTFPSIPAGPIFVSVDIYDSAAGSYLNASTSLGHYYGTSGMFTMNASGTIAPTSIVNHASPANSTWADGTWSVAGDVGVPGATGAIALSMNVPEPTTMALAGLAGAALMIFRRRK